MPALTSSMWAPAATWARASASTRLKSPAFISSASSLRPVGLMRSPIMTNGRSKPITTSRLAELTTVWVTIAPFSSGPFLGRADCVLLGRVAGVDVSARRRRALRARRARRATHAVGTTSASQPPANASRPSRSRVYSPSIRRQRRRRPSPDHPRTVGSRDATGRCPRGRCRCAPCAWPGRRRAGTCPTAAPGAARARAGR